MANNIEPTLKERESTHGPWTEGCDISQQLKACFDEYREERPHYINEALDRICMKLSRIAVGDCMNTEHWHDIQGYSKLTEIAINDELKVTKGPSLEQAETALKGGY